MGRRLFLYPEDMPVAVAAARCLAILMNSDSQAIRSESGEKGFAETSVLILDLTADESRLRLLAAMRQHGFRGPAVILSRASYGALMRRHPILKFGAESHEVCLPPWELKDLQSRVQRLKPVQEGNMSNLQEILSWTQTRLKQQIDRMTFNELKEFMDTQVFATHVDVALDDAPAMPLRKHVDRLLEAGRPEDQVAAQVRHELIRLLVSLGCGAHSS